MKPTDRAACPICFLVARLQRDRADAAQRLDTHRVDELTRTIGRLGPDHDAVTA